MRKEQVIRVLVVEPHERPYERRINNELSEMQELVGGYIEAMDIADDVSIVCNEEGKINRLPLNRALRDDTGEIWDVVAGRFFIAGFDYESGEFISLTDEQFEHYKTVFEYPEEFILVNGKIAAIKVEPNELI